MVPFPNIVSIYNKHMGGVDFVVSPRLGVFYNQHLINQYLIIKNNLLRILINSPRSS
jgi:hypothetical protein